jgi:uncharacterized protein (DUF4415 family)
MPKARKTTTRPARGKPDLARLRRMSDEEIARTAPPELRARPDDLWDGAAVMPAWVPPSKTPISLRVDDDVLDWFRAQGPRYQTHMNAVLREYMRAQRANAPQPRRRTPRTGSATRGSSGQ